MRGWRNILVVFALLWGRGGVANTFTRDGYGTLIASNGTPLTACLHPAGPGDSDSEVYYLRSRYYNQNTGRFWTMDTFEGKQADPLSLHKYLYCNANPVNGTDPSGHEYTIGNLLTTTAILTTLTTISGGAITYAAGMNAGLDEDGKPDAAIISVSESLQTRGAGADFGFDIVYHFKTQKMYAYAVGSAGFAPLSYFKALRNSHGPSFTAGFIWNMNSPEEWSGAGLTATWPLSVAHLLPPALFGGRNAIWGMMTQLAKREHNIRTSDIAVQFGISTSGPAFLKVGPRSNIFAAQAGLASAPIDLQAMGESLGDLLGPAADRLSTLPSLQDNPENVFNLTR